MAQPHERAPVLVELSEWSQSAPIKGLSLAGDPRSRELVRKLGGRLDIQRDDDGIVVTSTSFVGRVDVGPLRIAIRPKLPAMPLGRLLRYAYGLRDVAAIDDTLAPAEEHGFHDLLIALLAAEVEELLHRGLGRRYVATQEKLESPRGRLLIDRLIREGGVREARLPCHHVERRADWHLNRVLRTGLEHAVGMTSDRILQRRVHSVAKLFGDVERLARLQRNDLDKAERELTRLTAACRPALTIIRLLHESLGTAFDPALPPSKTPGFLFDMNIFFQRLLSRFLHDNLAATSRIEDEWAVRNLFAFAPDANPRRRQTPTPRPDYALFAGAALEGFLDAKYRDLWERSLPPEWLYQLSIYALASPAEVTVLLYATMSAEASDERVEVRSPISWAAGQVASVILRPVPLLRLVQLIEPGRADFMGSERRAFAQQLVSFRTLPVARKSGARAA
jgi:5-methylcytosine-specific restriction enzyme subunit McrC